LQDRRPGFTHPDNQVETYIFRADRFARLARRPPDLRNVVCARPRFLAALGRQLEQDLSRSREITAPALAGQSRRQQLGDQLAGAALHTVGALLGFRGSGWR
jgi:hypothetical protein